MLELKEKIETRDDSIETSFNSKIGQVQAGLNKELRIRDDFFKTSLSLISNKTNAIEDAIKDYPGKEVVCSYQDYVDSTDQRITFDRRYVEINDNGGDLNIQTGKFTAGTAGVYEVAVSIGHSYTGDHSAIQISLKTSSGRYQDNG